MRLESSLRKPSRLFHLTPVIDVVLILLIFFLLGSAFMVRSGITVSLPRSTSTLEGFSNARVLTISAGTRPLLLLDGIKIALSDLEEEFAGNSKGKSKGLIIRADELAAHGLIMKVTNMAMMAGYEIAFATASPEPE
jgi:biopolymer transport protein ExbD